MTPLADRPVTGTSSPKCGGAGDRVLSTLNKDGSRRWLQPRLSAGRFLNRRRAVGALLIILFTAIPFMRIGDKPVLLFDVTHRRFTFFGVEFLPTETLLLALLILSIFVAIFLLTALFGRVWCGYACPQTVYMEFVFRPIEQLLGGREAWKRPVKIVAYLIVSLYLANTFLAYFVGTDALLAWVTEPPGNHTGAFLVMAFVTLLMMIDFTYAREQVCTIMCPYGRLQSVMLDRHSLIIGYDEKRGEPRGPLRKSEPAAVSEPGSRGDCVDCKLCVTTCPTGIDIRDGLQMECIGCAQCIDACDRVMDKIGKPQGLIRYSSQHVLETGERRWLRPRVVLYPAVLFLVLCGLGYGISNRGTVDLTILRVRSTPYQVLQDGAVQNRVALKLTNKSAAARVYTLTLAGDGALTPSDAPIAIAPNESYTGEITITLPGTHFDRGRAEVVLLVTDDLGEAARFDHQVLGPLFTPGKIGSDENEEPDGDEPTDRTPDAARKNDR